MNNVWEEDSDFGESCHIRFRKSDMKRLENAIIACDEIIKRGLPCMVEARNCKIALKELLYADGKYLSRYRI